MTIANRYSKALFELVIAKNQVDETYQDLVQLRQVFKTNDDLIPALIGAELPISEKKELIHILISNASTVVSNLIKMVFDYGRMDDLVAIIDEFERRYDIYKQRVHADVVTAVKLDETQKSELVQTFAKRIGAKQVLLSEHVDPTILGGAIMSANNQTLDGSLSSKIEQIRRLLVK
ncbi:ATP synthase F1 sector delta chain [Paucilactobacillus wasatchensis]|uniref:ATP synthase subunit delta n=2 Tax=Paucilactobacillus wasatchensis TaxID=1335616 RepID=A0A0D0Y7K4_9LACO|nr:ATP synthase F1 sector delta chain [Paucilactobacillus wasatchensis]